jgi:Cu-Zn family superoxide dismutase
MKRLELWIGSALALGIAGCATAPESADSGNGGAALAADVRDASGRTLARAHATQNGDDIRIHVEAAGLPQGAYAAHVHTIGRCDGPDFTSAGPHWNPAGRQHGKDNPAGMHKGDLPNLLVGANGQGSFEFTIPGAQVSGGNPALLDADGSAVMIHASPDDYRTDPTGNAGGRIACGVLG